ncbi:hypothetical protein B5S32_g5800 [[Candida] boidinii]|nr:hypothetical protein B5S32_g5800 [[Candida] boidinii]GMF44316.1 unnamed protein product [[Candida] boidinii]
MSRPVPIISFPEDLKINTVILPKKSKTLIFLTKLFYSSGYTLLIIFIISKFLIKPLIKLNYDRRLNYLNHVFKNLNHLYLKISNNLSIIPSISINYNGTLYSDAICSTNEEDNISGGILYKDSNDSNIEIDSDSDNDDDDNNTDVHRAKVTTERNQVHFEDDETTIKNQKNNNIFIKKPNIKINKNLKNLKNTLLKLNISNYDSTNEVAKFDYNSNISEIRPLLFQLKQFQNYLDLISQDHPKEFFFKRRNNYGTYNTNNQKSNNILDDLNSEFNDCTKLLK